MKLACLAVVLALTGGSFNFCSQSIEQNPRSGGLTGSSGDCAPEQTPNLDFIDGAPNGTAVEGTQVTLNLNVGQVDPDCAAMGVQVQSSGTCSSEPGASLESIVVNALSPGQCTVTACFAGVCSNPRGFDIVAAEAGP